MRCMNDGDEKMIAHVKFKSNPEMYAKEISGLKPNTLRKPDVINDERFLLIEEYRRGDRVLLVIEIFNTITGESFRRLVDDVSYWDGYYIISWKHAP